MKYKINNYGTIVYLHVMSFISVRYVMILESPSVAETHSTFVAREWLFPSVNQHVVIEAILSSERLVALLAVVTVSCLSLCCMSPHVSQKIYLGGVCLWTLCTLVGFLA